MTSPAYVVVHFFKSRLSDKKHGDIYHRIFVINLFSLVGMLITGLTAITAIADNNQPLALILSAATVMYFAVFAINKNSKNLKFSSVTILYSLFALMVYLIYSGGVNNTGPLWLFMSAPVALFIHGLKRGLLDIGFLVLVISVMMFTPDNAFIAADYAFEFRLRLLYSFLTVTFLSAFYEYSRNASYQYTLDLSKKYEQLAKLDPLTKISNRRDALQLLEREQIKLKRTPGSLSIIMCDIDNFKEINDSYGHQAGDLILVELAKLFTSQCRSQDVIARWGGEEFLFILPQTSINNAIELSNKMHAAIAKLKIEYKDDVISLSVSMGISELGVEQKINAAINAADQFLYQAKASGKNQTLPKPR